MSKSAYFEAFSSDRGVPNIKLHPTGTIAACASALAQVPAAEFGVGHTWAFPSVILRKRP
jgi:hypothetical protein